ncbi:AAEL017157-PA [Aedes aegypti]|uniref:AAEL017157-PA n=1 Tax=Aedes aegypti TaxID=7159 RepID=J9HTW5_AEDAE|nr:AAEL017157-PA [Aedes aegypti]
MSWRRKIVGATIPHPIELIGAYGSGALSCDYCRKGGEHLGYVAAIIPLNFDPKGFDRGHHEPYLGSYTSESTGLVQPWEKVSNVPFIKRAMDMRNSIGWCVSPDDPLAQTLLENIRATTNQDPGPETSDYYRTGCPVHRFSCSRVSSGGFLAHSPIYATWMSISTDPLNHSLDPEKNYTFMFQPCLLYAQGVAGTRHSVDPKPHTVHCHIKCLDSLQEAEDVSLHSGSVHLC